MSDAAKSRELLAELNAERQKGTKIRRALTGGILLMFALAIGNTYLKVKNFDSEAFLASLGEQTNAKVWPLVTREMDKIAADAVPALSKAVADEAAAIMPKVSAQLVVEEAAFREHLHERMKSSLDAAFRTAAEAQKVKLEERFPQFTKDPARYDALLGRLNAGVQHWAMEELDTTFKAHIDVLQSINVKVQSLQTLSEADREKHGDPEAQEVLELFLEIMNARMEGEVSRG